MRKFFTVLIGLMMITMANAQSSLSDSLKAHYLKTYQQAIRYNDLSVAISALQNAIVETHPGQSLALRDTLSMLYFVNKSYYSSLLLAQEVTKSQPANTDALARTGECYQNLGDSKNAIAAYEIVCPILKKPYYYYQLAVCQYDLKRVAECEANVNKVLADTNSNHTAVNFVLPNGGEQQIPASAAALNLAAVMQMDNKNYEKAKQYLQAALKLYPDFVGAQQNLQVCNTNSKGTKPTTTTKPKGKG